MAAAGSAARGANPGRSTAPGRDLGTPEPIRAFGAESDFDKKYPFDIYGEEATPDARVWTVYKDHETQNDGMRIDGWNKTLDILLIFAGLFSAVVTTFIGESYQQLQPDWNEYTGRLMFAVLDAQRSLDPSFVPSNLHGMSPSKFSAPGLSRWINGLWVLSLVLNLGVALLAILAKQWLVQYDTRVADVVESTRDWALRHSFYATGLRAWHIGAIIDTLPVLLHLALILFLVGLALFFWTLSVAVASVVIVLTATLASLYVSTIALTFRYPACPYYIGWFSRAHMMISSAYLCFHWLPLPTAAQEIGRQQTQLIIRILSGMATAVAPTDVHIVAVNAIGAFLSSTDQDTYLGTTPGHVNQSLLSMVSSLLHRTRSDVIHSSSPLIGPHEDLSPPVYRYMCLRHAAVYLRLFLPELPRYADHLLGIWELPVRDLQGTCLTQIQGLARAVAHRYEELVPSLVSSLDAALRDRDWNLSTAQRIQTLMLLRYSRHLFGNADTYKSVALRLVQSTLAGTDTQGLAYQFSVLKWIFRERRVHCPSIMYEEVLWKYLAFYCRIINSRSVDLSDDSLVEVVLEGIVHCTRLVDPWHRDHQEFLPHLFDFLQSSYATRAPWETESFRNVILWLDCIDDTRLTAGAIDNLAGVELLVRTRDATACRHFRRLLVSQKHAGCTRALLRSRDASASCWRALCDAVPDPDEEDLRLVELIQIACTLAEEFQAQYELREREALIEELFAVDIITPTFSKSPAALQDARLTLNRVLARAFLPDCLSLLETLVCEYLPDLAPYAWERYSTALRARAHPEVRGIPFWARFRHLDAQFANNYPSQPAAASVQTACACDGP